MSHNPSTVNDLRCFCRTQPILAKYGLDDEGQSYIHIKSYKQRRIFSEIVITAPAAKVSIRCRECLRWFVVTMAGVDKVKLTEAKAPDFIGT